jgi:hypothetical protein
VTNFWILWCLRLKPIERLRIPQPTLHFQIKISFLIKSTSLTRLYFSPNTSLPSILHTPFHFQLLSSTIFNQAPAFSQIQPKPRSPSVSALTDQLHLTKFLCSARVILELLNPLSSESYRVELFSLNHHPSIPGAAYELRFLHLKQFLFSNNSSTQSHSITILWGTYLSTTNFQLWLIVLF